MKLYIRGDELDLSYDLAKPTLITHHWLYYNTVHKRFYGSVDLHEVLKTHVVIVDVELLWGYIRYDARDGFVLTEGYEVL